MADNLLDKASILLTPTAYDNGSMLSIKPENGDGDFDFSRNSAATRVNEQGLVENVQIISSELVSNGNFSQIGTEEVLNGNFSQEGSEEIVNGDFSNGSTNWSLIGDVSISNGVATFLDSGSNTNSRLIQSSISIGNSYKVTFEVTRYVNGRAQVVLGSGTTISVDISSGVGTYTIYGVSSGSNQFELKRNGGYPNFDFDIDNVSVKEVGQNWNLIGTTTITENQANIVTTSAVAGINQSNILTIGKSYKLSYNIVSNNNGGLKISGNEIPSVVGNNTYYFTASVTDLEILRNSGATDVTITNISVKEVGQDWTLGTNWSIDQANSKAYADGTSSGLLTQPSLVSVSGSKYQIQFNISDYSAGSFRIYFGGVFTPFINANGAYSYTINASAVDTFATSISSSFVGSITNISVKEITDDTNIPRINYEGFSYQDSLGSEEIVNGNWNSHRAAEFEITDNLIYIENYGNTYGGIEQFFSVSSGKIFQLKYNAIEGTTSSDWRFDVGSFQGGTDLYSKGQVSDFTENTLITSTTSEIWIRTYNNTPTIGDNFSVDNISVKEYLGQEVVPDSGCGSWLLEPQSTNLVTQSEALSTMQTQATITDNNLLSPTGDVNASLVVENTATNSHGIRKATIISTNASAADYTISVFAKKKERQFVQFQFYADSTQYNSSLFNLNDGTTTGDSSTHKIEDYGNGWYRCSFTDSITQSTGSYNFAAAYMSQSLTSYYAGDGTSGIYMFGFQLEQQSYPTSYIPTNGATNTRLQDIANNSGNSSLISSTEGVLYAEVSNVSKEDVSNIALTDGTNSQRVQIYFNKYALSLMFFVRVDGVLLATHTVSSSGINYEETNKIAIKYKTNDISFWLNGTKVGTDTTGTLIPNKFTQLGFNSGGGGTFYGKVKAVAVYKEALTDSELQSLTTI